MIDLPAHPAPSAATPSLIDFGGFLEPMLGGAVQRIERLGNRFRINVTMPPLPSADLGRVWLSRLLRGKSEGARMEYPLLGFDPGVPGAPVVDLAGQAGRTLNLRGLTPAYAIREGQPFSVQNAAGRHFLHFADAGVVVASNGKAAVPLSPMLRFAFADGATCHFTKPMIEGFIKGDAFDWEMSLEHNLGLSFTIDEAA
jgi:hypothetical protein